MRRTAASALVTGLALAGIVGLVASPADAVVTPAGQVCFGVPGTPGDEGTRAALLLWLSEH